MTVTVSGVSKAFVRFDEDGQITAWGHQDQNVTAYQQSLGQSIMEGEGGPGHYVADGEIIAREENPATVSGTTISGLPIPSTLKIGTETYVVDDGEADLDLTYPGTYRVEITTLRHLPKTVEITV